MPKSRGIEGMGFPSFGDMLLVYCIRLVFHFPDFVHDIWFNIWEKGANVLGN